MAQDENLLRGGSYSGTTGTGAGDQAEANGGLYNSIRSKKVKQKKVPQRGLGVAQLERIREEQQRKEALQAANTLANNVIGCLGDSVQTPTFRPTVSPSPNPIPSQSMLNRPVPLVQNVEILNRDSIQIPKQVIGLDSISSPRHGNWPKSLLSSQMEPPSNQSFRGNNYPNTSTEEDKMAIGMKRPYPFSLEGAPASSYRCNIPSYAASRSTDDLVSCSNRYKAQIESRNKHLSSRESYANTTTLLDHGRDSTEVIRDDERLKGDFLTLAPPLSAASPPSNSKHEHLLYSKRWHDLENPRDQMLRLGPSGSAERSFSFFPDKFERDQNTRGVDNGNDGNSETIDLNLKL